MTEQARSSKTEGPDEDAPSFFTKLGTDPISNPHDALFQAVIGIPEAGREALALLPAELYAHLDTSSYELLNGHYISEKLRHLYSDALVRVGLKAQEKPAYLYFLIEHMSRKDRLMPYRFGRYMFAAWRGLMKKGRLQKLPLMIPILFYNGPGRYKEVLELADIIDVAEGMDQYALRLKVFVINLATITDERLKMTKYLGPAFLALKHALDTMMPTDEIMFSLKNVPLSHQSHFAEMVVWYIMSVRKEVDIPDLIRSAKANVGPQGEKIMMFIDKLRAESEARGEARGRSEGRAEGEAKGKLEVAQSMLAAGIGFENVLRFTGLSEELLLGIKNGLSK